MTEKEQQQGVLAQKYGAELQQIDSHVSQMEALLQRNSAEQLQVTREEFELMRRSLGIVRQSLSHLLLADDNDWHPLKEQFERAWSDFQEHSRRIGTASGEKPPAQG
ncbi:hypothetical protein [Archangium sp.]|jgi:hypothetical protein|uniref:hypothetical protein n=1 Tax=Archangium sp. TaxID=1872627 RepID=UPI002ED78941